MFKRMIQNVLCFVSIFITLLTFLAEISSASSAAPHRPHIVHFVMDDVGWQDVGFHAGSKVHTPTLNALAKNGIELQSLYVQPVCSPTRAALQLGRFPFRAGVRMQHFNTLEPGSAAHLNTTQPTIAELLGHAGYKRYMIGKWHLGYQQDRFTPLGRGFQSHLGYYQGMMNYTSLNFPIDLVKFIPGILREDLIGLDWWANGTAKWSDQGTYSKILYDREMHRILDQFNPNDGPLYMYYAHQIAHEPLMNPPNEFYKHCINQPNPTRRTYCAMMAALDDSIDQLVDKLKQKNMWNNTLLVIHTDNGGLPKISTSFPFSMGSNIPLRAGKATTFQGGVRGTGIVNGGVLPANRRGTIIDKALIHAVDWLPTFATLAGLRKAELPSNLDGLDATKVIFDGETNLHESIPLDINKNIQYVPDYGSRWAIVDSDGWKAIYNEIHGYSANYDGWWYPNGTHIPGPNQFGGKFLFDLNKDPNEENNLYQDGHPRWKQFEQKLAEFEKDYGHSQPNFPHLSAIPSFHNNTWAPFKIFLEK